jgi:hypothetical protein
MTNAVASTEDTQADPFAAAGPTMRVDDLREAVA